ncbi:hypothetical protein CY34DRAFT_70153 [Suillus luteus UH-Slu-Lm8-n1]|uniref:U4/U6.U5 small nuclear ribonucleoprotein 27kDa protein domain-containing protein n=1 Tax=Suillus luteus UH-Slu-Lm8-n1 TaxID=930992 RepID=A0A0D0BIA6_9AGAM|nr:hypothetical protein CY34DRAFT_70153 [Suillus luteus UH-Slu-Lm8-n1]
MSRGFQKSLRKLELHPQVRLILQCKSSSHHQFNSAPSADAGPSSSQKRPNLDPDALSEEGEAMDATNADEEDMMAAMGLAGFGTTKGKHVEGNQEGFVDIKKIRTWRQYMNRRGGFNRPLDKVK